MYPLKEHSIKALSLHQPLSFTELLPYGVSSNRLAYHLKKLVTLGYIKKTVKGYMLTDAGRDQGSNANAAKLPSRPDIRILIICRNKKGEVLVEKRKRQPFFGFSSFPSGEVLQGEKALRAAERILREKGYAAELAYRGDAYISIYLNGQLHSQVLFHVFTGEKPEQIGRMPKRSRPEWREFKTIRPKALIPGFAEIYKRVSVADAHLFLELTKKI